MYFLYYLYQKVIGNHKQKGFASKFIAITYV